ncbi:MAG: iron ABC transporter permease [Hyphomonadaceae bacterium]|nr:iron ABC transporter permease [Hyphomonadaceae bacterium]
MAIDIVTVVPRSLALPAWTAQLPLALITLVLATPVLAAALSGLLAGGGETWQHILATDLWSTTLTTILMLALTGALILAIAIPAAWLVTMYSFPGRAIFEWLLILPLAAPGYVLAISYYDLMSVSGPLQSAIRKATDWGARDYWFPDITSLPGLCFVLAVALYPYVYLTARAAFTTTSICAIDAARTLGARPVSVLWRVAIPSARPAIVAGLTLALMEAAADYGAAGFLGVRTLTVGLFRAWSSYGDAAAAARMALILLALAIGLQWLERLQRGEAGVQATSKRWQALERPRLAGASGWLAAGFCGLVFALGFGLPVLRLGWIALETGDHGANFGGALVTSLLLASAGAGVSFLIGITIALYARRGWLARLAKLAASGGYAVPGAVLALGGLVALSQMGLNMAGGLALLILIWIYAARFTAAGAQPMEAALARAPRSMGDAARALGTPPLQRIWRIDLPIAFSGALVAALILFVEILKELPATLMLRPANWDTLAVRAYAYASDERLAAAALPCLLITAAGLVPVILLSWRLSRARPGS